MEAASGVGVAELGGPGGMESKIDCLVSSDLLAALACASPPAGEMLMGFGAELAAGGGMPIIVG